MEIFSRTVNKLVIVFLTAIELPYKNVLPIPVLPLLLSEFSNYFPEPNVKSGGACKTKQTLPIKYVLSKLLWISEIMFPKRFIGKYVTQNITFKRDKSFLLQILWLEGALKLCFWQGCGITKFPQPINPKSH